MQIFHVFLAITLCGLCTTTLAAATRCECEYDKWVGDCRASIKRSKNWVQITSNTQQCSRVDWYIDGQPQITIVTDGVESKELLNISDTAKIAIQSCKVCKDKMMSKPMAPSPGALQQRQTPAAAQTSPFDGVWTGSERNIFGFKHSIRAQFDVQGNALTGTWETEGQGPTSISGTVSGAEANTTISGGAPNTRLRLINPETLEYSFGQFGSGTLHKSP